MSINDRIHTRNVTRVFRMASREEVAAWSEWYADAHAHAETLSELGGITVDQAAGILSAFSPLNGWGNNLNLAYRFVRAHGRMTGGYLGTGIDKASRIWGGADPAETLNGLKTVAFYRAIASAGADPRGVVIDRHAWAIVTNTRGREDAITPLRYRLASDAYRRAARILSREYGTELSATVVQAVTWVVWRRLYWSAGAFDGFDAAQD